VRLVIAGKVWKDDFAKYQTLIDELELRAVVKLDIRYIPDAELTNFYRAANILVLPYRRIYQSGVVLMAMTFGTPVLVSNIPGMLEVVTHAENGLIFEEGNHVDLAEKLLFAANSPEKLGAYVDSARELMHTQYAWSGIGKQTADLYRKILGV
jgi:glycosyltransferase involved in cell wall biosynthesis